MTAPQHIQRRDWSRAIAHDERGAILVIGTLLAPFLVSAIYYLLSCATTMMQREGLQHAADASVFAPAVLSARAMNAIAVMNVLMMCIMSIVIPVRSLLPAYTTIAGMGCNDACTCARVADAARAAASLAQKSARMERDARDLLTALSDAQTALGKEVPRLGEDAARQSAARNDSYLESPRASVYSPSLAPEGCRIGLPIEDDTFRQVCRRTRPYVWEIAFRIAGPTTLATIGPCLSGGMALGLAAPSLSNPEGSVCREAAAPPCSGSGPHPKKVFGDAKNGHDYMQYWSRLQGRAFDRTRRGVELATSGQRGAEPRRALNVGFAQSEFFYDCRGPWSSPACNNAGGQEDAMWNTRWTARLRRVHPPTISFSGDGVVKNELTSASHWASLRDPLMGDRRDPRGGSTEAASTLRGGSEGPLQ